MSERRQAEGAGRLLAGTALAIGGGSLLLFFGFLVGGAPGWVELGLSSTGALALDLALSLLFFVQHSGMVRSGFRARLAARMPAAYHGAVYSITGGLVLVVVVVLWQESGETLLVMGAWGRLASAIVIAAALAIFIWAARTLHHFDPFGTGALDGRRHHLDGEPAPLVVRGPFRWIRHPFYLAVILLIWSRTTFTADRLLFNLLWSAWIVVGARLEEMDLIAAFGEPYRAYRRRVPMLLPRRRPWP